MIEKQIIEMIFVLSTENTVRYQLSNQQSEIISFRYLHTYVYTCTLYICLIQVQIDKAILLCNDTL